MHPPQKNNRIKIQIQLPHPLLLLLLLQEEQPVAVKSLIVNPPMFFGYDVLYVVRFVWVLKVKKYFCTIYLKINKRNFAIC